jgi:hypothetical protein
MSSYSYKIYFLTSLNDYYRDYKDYIVARRCCKKSNLLVNDVNINTVGGRRCCSNNNANYYNSYSDFLSAKKCCYDLIIQKAYKNLQ